MPAGCAVSAGEIIGYKTIHELCHCALANALLNSSLYEIITSDLLPAVFNCRLLHSALRSRTERGR